MNRRQFIQLAGGGLLIPASAGAVGIPFSFWANAASGGGPPAPPIPGIVRWPYNEGQGVLTTDVSGNHHIGTLSGNTGAAGWTTNTPASASPWAIVTDFTNCHCMMCADANLCNFTSSDFTFSFWMRSTNNQNFLQQTALFYKGQYQVNGYVLETSTAGELMFWTNQLGANQTTLTLGAGITLNTWCNVIVTRSGAAVKIYINGVDKTGVAGTHIDPASSLDPFVVGAYGPGVGDFAYGFVGDIDDFCVDNTCWTPAQVLAFYNQGVNGGVLAHPKADTTLVMADSTSYTADNQ